MMMLGLYDAPPSSGGSLLLDASAYADGATISTNEHGFEALPATIRRRLLDAFRFYDQAGLIYIGLTWNGAIVWEGRLEDPTVLAGADGSGLNIQALGAWRALTDAPYTALWSKSTVADFIPVRNADLASHNEVKWTMDTNNRLYIAPNKNENFANGGDIGGQSYVVPYNSARAIVGVSFDFEYKAPANWNARCDTRDRAYANLNNRWILGGNGAVQTGSVFVTFAAWERVEFDIINNTGGNVLKASDTGVDYLIITNLRIVSSITNKVDTTLTLARAAGAGVTATVGSTARMYVGQRLCIIKVGGVSESVTVLSVPSSTTFTATFVNGYAIGDKVQAHVIYGDEIAKDLVSAIGTLNSSQLSSSTALIQSPGLDLTDEIYEDEIPADTLMHLIALGDNQTTPRQWETGVWEGRVLYFRPRGDTARTWYVDVTNLQIARTLEDLASSVYAVYQDATGQTLRTAANTDSASVTRYGLTRRQSLSVDTTSSTQAGVQRDTQLADHKDPLPRATVAFPAVYDAAGGRWPLWMVRSGDTVTIRNLPPTISTSIDRVRTFRISHTLYNLSDRTLEIELEVPPPRLATLLARRTEGIR